MRIVAARGDMPMIRSIRPPATPDTGNPDGVRP